METHEAVYCYREPSKGCCSHGHPHRATCTAQTLSVRPHRHTPGGLVTGSRMCQCQESSRWGVWCALPRARRPPVTKPVYSELYMSCLPLCDSMTHSIPAYSIPSVAKLRAYMLHTTSLGLCNVTRCHCLALGAICEEICRNGTIMPHHHSKDRTRFFPWSFYMCFAEPASLSSTADPPKELGCPWLLGPWHP